MKKVLRFPAITEEDKRKYRERLNKSKWIDRSNNKIVRQLKRKGEL